VNGPLRVAVTRIDAHTVGVAGGCAIIRDAAKGLVAALALLGSGCASESPGNATVPGGALCPDCSAWDEPPASSGSASTVLPTPCQESEQRSPIEEATARELGFGPVIDQLTRQFTSSFAWVPLETTEGAPASGFAPLTSVTGQTTLAAFRHVAPSLDGCEDSLEVTLNFSAVTDDGAIRIEGPVEVSAVRTDLTPRAWGRLDLSRAEGSLRLHPSDFQAPIAGHVSVGLRFFSDQLRGQLSIGIGELRGAGSDVHYDRFYSPIEGRWPNDDCEFWLRPLAPTEPGAAPDGRSMAELRSDLQGMLDRVQPLEGSWGTGPTTEVTARIGDPTSICWGGNELGYRAPLVVTSDDGTIQIDQEATGSLGFLEDGTLRHAWLEIFDYATIPAADFPAVSGLHGVDFGSYQAALWYTNIFLAEDGVEGVRGVIGVEAVDVDGSMTGVEYGIIGPFAMFTWAE